MLENIFILSLLEKSEVRVREKDLIINQCLKAFTFFYISYLYVSTYANLIQCRQRDLQGLLKNCFSNDANDDIKIENR